MYENSGTLNWYNRTILWSCFKFVLLDKFSTALQISQLSLCSQVPQGQNECFDIILLYNLKNQCLIFNINLFLIYHSLHSIMSKLFQSILFLRNVIFTTILIFVLILYLKLKTLFNKNIAKLKLIICNFNFEGYPT